MTVVSNTRAYDLRLVGTLHEMPRISVLAVSSPHFGRGFIEAEGACVKTTSYHPMERGNLEHLHSSESHQALMQAWPKDPTNTLDPAFSRSPPGGAIPTPGSVTVDLPSK